MLNFKEEGLEQSGREIYPIFFGILSAVLAPPVEGT